MTPTANPRTDRPAPRAAQNAPAQKTPAKRAAIGRAAAGRPTRGPFSPLVLADRLIGLAQEADGAGFPESAARLIGLVYAVLDDEGALPA